MDIKDAMSLIDEVDESLIERLLLVEELSKEFRRYLLKAENKDYVPASYCSEFLDCLDSFI